MDIQTAKDYLSRVTYRPGWTFEIYQGAFEGPHLHIYAEVADSNNPDKMIPLDIHSPIPLMVLNDIENFMGYLAWRLKIIETHEMREWLKWDNKVVFNPHAMDADQDLPL